jgi:hypothetical protein
MSIIETGQTCALASASEERSQRGSMSEPSLIDFILSQAFCLDLTSKISPPGPFGLGKRLRDGAGLHKTDHSVFKLPIRLIRNNYHV